VLLGWVWTHQIVLSFAPNKTQYFNFFSLIYFFWSFLYCMKIGWWYFFSFEIELNFLIKACLFLRFKNTFKKFKFFFLFNFFPFLLCNFFSYGKEKINWWDFFLYYTKVGWWYFFFHLRLDWIFLLKHVCFCV
jgi:hypothetical protein